MAVQFGVAVLARAGLSAWLMQWRDPEERKQLLVFHAVDMVASSILTYMAFKDFHRGSIQFGIELALYRFSSVTTALSITKLLCKKPLPFHKGMIMGIGATDIVLAAEIVRSRFVGKPFTLNRTWF